MGHMINGFIARSPGFGLVRNPKHRSSICRLEQGFEFMPISKQMIDPDEQASGIAEFYGLTDHLRQWAADVSSKFRIAYIETEYFGGTGGQSAAIWEGGQLVLGPLVTADAINQVLRLLGAVRGRAADEFEAIGLGRYRSNEDWIDARNRKGH